MFRANKSFRVPEKKRFFFKLDKYFHDPSGKSGCPSKGEGVKVMTAE